MVNEQDDPPVAYGIDHGLSWSAAGYWLQMEQAGTPVGSPDANDIRTMIDNLGTPFVPNFVPYDELFNKRDLDRARAALDVMEPRFNEMGKYMWIGISRQILDMIEQQIDDTLGQQA